MFYSGALSAGVSNVIVIHGIGKLGPTRVTALQTLVPALAVVLAFIFLGEAIRLGAGDRRDRDPLPASR